MTGYAAIVGVDVWVVMIVPARTMDVVVIAVVEGYRVWSANPGVVGRHGPHESGTWVAGAETEGLCRTVDLAVVDQPDALHIDWHIDLFSGVGVVAVKPNLVEGRRYLFGPHIVDENVGGQLVCVTAINHQFVFIVQQTDSAQRLIIGEIQGV